MMFKIFKKIFKINSNQPNIKKEANKYRNLKVHEEDVAVVLRKNGKVDILLTKMYSPNQPITPSEDCIMAIGFFLKQEIFRELIINQFHTIANKDLEYEEQ